MDSGTPLPTTENTEISQRWLPGFKYCKGVSTRWQRVRIFHSINTMDWFTKYRYHYYCQFMHVLPPTRKANLPVTKHYDRRYSSFKQWSQVQFDNGQPDTSLFSLLMSLTKQRESLGLLNNSDFMLYGTLRLKMMHLKSRGGIYKSFTPNILSLNERTLEATKFEKKIEKVYFKMN